MQLCESILMALIATIGIYATFTDIKNGIIQNKALFIVSAIGLIVNSVYFGIFAREFIRAYLINLTVVSAFAVALYGFHFWAAGDSKLLICINFLFPARLYDDGVVMYAPGIIVFIYVFLIAYIYIVVDSIVCFIRKDRFYSGRRLRKEDVERFIIEYLMCFVYMRTLGELLRFALGDFYYNNQIIFSFFFFFIAIKIHEKEFFRKWYIIALALVFNLVFLPSFRFQVSNLYGYSVLFITLFLRYLLSGYNYKQIPTATVEKGMVLSIPTVMMFTSSRVKGLPKMSFEDMRSRLSEEEADAVRRWKESKQGKETITIVKKIPFAIFIVLGELVFFSIRIWR